MDWVVLPGLVMLAASTSQSAGGCKPKDLPEFNWINAVLGSLKPSLGGVYHAFDFANRNSVPRCISLPFNRCSRHEMLPLRFS